MLSDIEGLLNEFNQSASEYLSDLEFDQEDFIQVEERLNLINRFKEKYGNSIAEVLRYQERSRERSNACRMRMHTGKNSRENWRRNGRTVEALCGQGFL